MKILVADDDDVARLALEALLSKRGHTVVAVEDGGAAWRALESDEPPGLAVLDWLMPDVDGLEVCRRVRQQPRLRSVYLLLLTARGSTEHIVAGLEAGANDYVTKPFEPAELEARINVGVQVASLQAELAERVRELEREQARVKQLHGLLPICCYCKRIRNEQDYWQQVEHYISQHADVSFSHGICPQCFHERIEPELKLLH